MPLRRLPPLPFEEALSRDADALSRLADAYLAEAEHPTWTGCLFAFVPLRLFDAVLGSAVPVPPPGFLFALHASGVLGGWWLRRALRAAQPDGMLTHLAAPPERARFEDAMARARAALDAAGGDDAAALAFAEESLPGHVATFGYHLGCLLEIGEHPPDDVPERPARARERGPLDAVAPPRRLAALGALRPAARRLASPPTARWERLAEEVAASQEAEAARGRQVWSTGLSARGLDAGTYGELLDASAATLEVAQAAALAAAWAVAEGDAEWARRAALASAGMAPWLGGYAMALLDPAHDADPSGPWPELERPP